VKEILEVAAAPAEEGTAEPESHRTQKPADGEEGAAGEAPAAEKK